MRHFYIFCWLLLSISIAYANALDDWGEVGEIQVVKSEPQKKIRFSNYWDQHFYGGIIGTMSFGDNHERYYTEFKLGYNEHWKNFKLVTEVAFRKFLVNTSVDVIDISDQSVLEWYKDSISYQIFELKNAYFDYYPISSILISVGKQTHVWGQLDVFSPVDLLLPMDFDFKGFSLNKADNRMPQTTVKLSFYPVSQVELSGYYFPYFEESSAYKMLDFTNNFDSYDGVEYNWTKVSPSVNDQSSSAVRLSWYALTHTLAVTYYDGFNHSYPVFRQKYSEVSDGYFYQTEYGYYPKKGVGFELSVPFGQLNFKFDGTISDFFHIVDVDNATVRDALNQYNDGYRSVSVYMGLYSFGVDANFDTWFFNGYLTKVNIYKNSDMDEFWDIYESIYAIDFYNIPVIPMVNFGFYFNKDKKGVYGMSLGYFSGYIGGAIYLTNQISESVSWALSFDVIGSYSNLMLLSQLNDFDSSGEFTEYNFFEPKFTFGLGYLL